MRTWSAFALTAAVTLIAITAVVVPVSAESHAPVYRVIVNPNNPITSADREFLADAFLKKVVTWPDNDTIRPADLAENSPVRRRFSEEILRRSVSEVKGYWQQRIFSGRDVPPPEFDTDEEVVKYVLKYDGAIGYVSATADLASARVITVR